MAKIPSQNGNQIQESQPGTGTPDIGFGTFWYGASNRSCEKIATVMKPTNEPMEIAATRRQRGVRSRPPGKTNATASGHA